MVRRRAHALDIDVKSVLECPHRTGHVGLVVERCFVDRSVDSVARPDLGITLPTLLVSAPAWRFADLLAGTSWLGFIRPDGTPLGYRACSDPLGPECRISTHSPLRATRPPAPTPDSALFRYASSWRNDRKWPFAATQVRRQADGRWLLADSAGVWPMYGTVCDPPRAGDPPQHWAGRTAVLADGANASATFLFLTLVRRNGLAPIVGRPAGGNQRGIDGGLVLFTRLPYSGVEIDVPFFAQEPAVTAPAAARLPDVAVEWTAVDVAGGRDPDVWAALRLLQRAAP